MVSSLCSDEKDEEEDHIEHGAKKLKLGRTLKLREENHLMMQSSRYQRF